MTDQAAAPCAREEGASRRRAARDRRRAAVVAVPIVSLSLVGVATAAFTPVLLREHPLLLLFLEARNRYLLLVSPRVDFLPFVVVGVLRRFATDPFFFLAGRWFGERAVRWAERHTVGGARAVEVVERWFRRFASPLVFMFPGALVCVLAGATGMRPARFVALNLSGTLLTVLALWHFAEAVSEQLELLVSFVERQALWLTAVFVALTALWLVVHRRRTGTVVDLPELGPSPAGADAERGRPTSDVSGGRADRDGRR